MVEATIFVPLSPPTSPHMAVFGTVPSLADWQPAHMKALDSIEHSEDNIAMLQSDVSAPHPDGSQHPMLKTRKTFPRTLKNSGFHFQDGNSANNSNGSPLPQHERITISNLDEDVGATEMSTVGYGGSSPTSPVSRLTPQSQSDERNDGQQSLSGSSTEGLSKDDHEQKPALSAAELRAQKRKMKRFRLTHNQTRFLMSEFARQAHPDAAHRERLAREIPGLSARQVQVWFQNRRAKLKRLTTDDQERMMRSRALPENFDMTQALHSPYGTTQPIEASLTSLCGFDSAYGDGHMVRPLTVDTLRRLPDGAQMPPAGLSPSFGGYSFTPPQSVTDTLSPVSTSAESHPFGLHSPPLETMQRRSHSFTSASAPGPGYPIHPQPPRLQIHDRVGRSRAETIASPLRTSMSYAHLGDDDLARGSQSPTGSMNSPQMGGDHPDSRNMMSSPGLPYGLGYHYNQLSAFQASASNRARSYSTGMPRRIELTSRYPSSAATTSSTPQTSTYPIYSSATTSPMGITPTHSYGIPTPTSLHSAPHHVTSFQTPFLRHDDPTSPGSGGCPAEHASFPPIGSVMAQDGRIGGTGSPHAGEAHDGDLRLATSAF